MNPKTISTCILHIGLVSEMNIPVFAPSVSAGKLFPVN
jgi:hypothetical protein